MKLITLPKRMALGVIAVGGLGIVYIFQYTDVLSIVSGERFQEEWHFIVNRAVRILLNDSLMLVLIFAIFYDRNVLRLAFFVQLFDLLVLYPIYLTLKLPTEGITELSSPFLSQFHRLIVNPTLMILLIPAIFYQRLGISKAKESKKQ